MKPLIPAALFALSLCTSLAAQGFPAGFQDLTFANTTGGGSASIPARIHYPAQSAGQNAPLRPQTGGYPVVVFLHGFAALGRFYGPLGEALASRGYVGVFPDTGQFSAPTLTADGIALFALLTAANQQPGHVLQGALNMTRAGVAGHSMGGGATISVLAANPGYLAGVCYAPVNPGAAAGQVRTPVLILHGEGDAIVPLATGPQPLFDGLTQTDPLKVLHLMDGSVNHTNLVGFALGSATDRQIFESNTERAAGFFDRYLKDDSGALEQVVGDVVRQDPRFRSISMFVRAPDLFVAAEPRIGTTVGVRILAEQGPALLALSTSTANLPTPFGPLLLDPSGLVVVSSGLVDQSGLFTTALPIPQNLFFLGRSLPFQGLATGSTLRLTPLLDMQFQP